MPPSSTGQLTVLEQSLETLKLLPADLQRQLILINELDKKVLQMSEVLEEKRQQFFDNVKIHNWPADRLKKPLEEIRELENECSRIASEKVAVASDTFSTVQSFITRVSEDLCLLKLKLGDSEPQYDLSEFEDDEDDTRVSSPRSRRGQKRSFSQCDEDSEEDESYAPRKASRRTSRHSGDGESFRSNRGNGPSGHSSAELSSDDESLDERSLPARRKQGNATHFSNARLAPGFQEKSLFCFCRQPSHGEMIGCDNSKCTYEWFHFKCVGLTFQPEGSWYCPECLLGGV